MEKVVLTDGESVEIVVAKGAVTVDSNGILKVDAGTYGATIDIFETAIHTQNSQSLNQHIAAPYQPSKAEKVGQYLYMLYEAQKCGHEMHKEIDESLKQYKAELGI